VSDVGIQPVKSECNTARPLRIRGARPDGAYIRCTTDAGDMLLPRVPASFLRPGDALRVNSFSSPVQEYLSTQNLGREKARHLYFGRIGHVTQPWADKRDEYFLRAEVTESAFGIQALHLPNSTVRDYFYFFTLKEADRMQPTLYDVLRSLPTATPADLRLSYRVRRIELETSDSARTEVQRAERAFNLLAHPDLRSCYDALLQDAAAPALFPYGGFGQCVVAGDLAEDGKTFFVRRLLSYRPDQRQRRFRAPLRRIEYLNGYALYRDSRRKAEVFLDPALLPVGWDPTWNQWKHLVGTKIGVAGTFVESGKYRHIAGEWRLIQWRPPCPAGFVSPCPRMPRSPWPAHSEPINGLESITRRSSTFGGDLPENRWMNRNWQVFAGALACRPISISRNSVGSRTTIRTSITS
jgi:hypothetical protein